MTLDKGVLMKPSILDWIFKIGLLIIGIALVFAYYQSTQNKNNRYQYIDHEYGRTIFDTQTGRTK